MNSETEEPEEKQPVSPVAVAETSSSTNVPPLVPSIPSVGVVFEAATQTPTNEQCNSPLFTQKGYCLKTTGHSNQALNNIQKMRQHDQVKLKFCLLHFCIYESVKYNSLVHRVT